MNKKYEVIYADPPWRYDFSTTKNRDIENKYPTMSVDEICNLEVPRDDNSVLYLWATAPKLLEALKVMDSWGFTYKTHLIWDKEIIGMGYWFRGQHELLLIGTRGKFSPPTPSERISSLMREKRTKHSKKPNVIRDYIAKWFPACAKLEMFAREKFPGWDSWGNEIESDITLEVK
jgi:N6-adenosine-specific RNA methylase IME4